MNIADSLSTMYNRLDLILAECNNALASKGVTISASTLAEVPNLIRRITTSGESIPEDIYYYYGKGTNKLPLGTIDLPASLEDTWSIHIEAVAPPTNNEEEEDIFLSGDFTINFQNFFNTYLVGYFVSGSNITVLDTNGDTISRGSITFDSGETKSSNLLSREGYEGGPDRHVTIDDVVFPEDLVYRLTVVDTN